MSRELLLAYVDPGVGATVMQLILAGIVGVGALLKLRWHQIRGVFRRDALPAHETELDSVELEE